MTTFISSSNIEKTLLESSPRSGWVCTKFTENSNIRPQEAHLTDFEDGTRLIGVLIHLSYKFCASQMRFPKVLSGVGYKAL